MATGPPPRPSVWEVPNLKDERAYFVTPSPLLNRISARLNNSLKSFGAGGGTEPSRRDIESFLRVRLRFPSNNNDDWHANRLLGAGGYGRVGQWLKRDQNGVTVDELAIKDQKDSDDVTVAVDWTKYSFQEPNTGIFNGLLKEAVIQKQLNEHQCENILHLRGYAFITNSFQPTAPVDRRPRNPGRRRGRVPPPPAQARVGPNHRGRYRFYLEFAPYQSLYELIDKYRAWDRLLPEAFLWHVFDSLAAAVETLSEGPPGKLKFSSQNTPGATGTRRTQTMWPSNYGVVHFDIKPHNIFLGYEQWKDDSGTTRNGGSAVLNYPVVKLADFGLAVISGRGHPNNVEDNYWKASPGYALPEQHFYSIEWLRPINHGVHNNTGQEIDRTTANQNTLNLIETYKTAERANPNFSYDNAANVYSIGKVMYDLMTLSHPGDLDHFMNLHATRHRYNGRNEHFMSFEEVSRFSFGMASRTNTVPQNPPYSDDLNSLIRECLRPAIQNRMTVETLRERTQRGLAKAEWDSINPNQPIPARRRRRPERRRRRGPPLTRHNPPRQKVYYDGHDINTLAYWSALDPHLNIVYQANGADYQKLIERRWVDDAWPAIQPPAAKWAQEQHRQPTYHRQNYPVGNDGRIVFP